MSDVLTQCADGVGSVTLNRPECMNAVTVDLSRSLENALRTLGDRSDVYVIVIRGAGGNFCAGGDFEEVQRLRAAGPDALKTLFTAFRTACGVVAEVEIPVIAAVEGVAMAGGFELMQAVDFVLVSDDARISDNHVNFGMIPGGGSTARLARIVGRQHALGLLLSGDRLSGQQAAACGLAYRAFPQADFETSVAAFAARLASRSRAATTAIKRLVYSGIEGTLSDALTNETDQVVAHISGEAGVSSVAAFDNREVHR